MKANVKFWEQFSSRKDVSDWFADPENEAKRGSCNTASEFIHDNLPKEQAFQKSVEDGFAKAKRDGNIPKGSIIWKHSAGVYQRSGLPDLMAVVSGQFFAWEVKRPFIGAKPTMLQLKAIEDINAAGGHASAASFWRDAEKDLRAAGVWKE